MLTPISADYFIQHGVSADQAASLAAEHNRLSGMPSEAAGAVVEQSYERLAPPVPKPSSLAPPTDAQRARAEREDILQRRARGEINDYQWRQEFEAKVLSLAGVGESISAYNAATPGDQNAARVLWDADATQESFERSIDLEPPAQGPHQCHIPLPVHSTDEDIEQNTRARDAIFALGFGREKGGNFAQTINETMAQLHALRDNPQAVKATVKSNNAAIRANYTNAEIEAVRGMLREVGQKSEAAQWWIENMSHAWETPRAVSYLLGLAQARGRSRNKS